VFFVLNKLRKNRSERVVFVLNKLRKNRSERHGVGTEPTKTKSLRVGFCTEQAKAE